MIGSSYSDIVPEKLTNIVDKNEWPSRYEELQCNSSDFDLLKNLWNLTDEVKDQDLVPQKKWKGREEGRKVWWCGGGGGGEEYTPTPDTKKRSPLYTTKQRRTCNDHL